MKAPYRALRDAHLGAALIAAAFLAVYALSALQMAYVKGRPKPAESERRIAVPTSVDSQPRPLALWLMREHGLRGELVEVGRRRGALTLRIERPGSVHRVAFDETARDATVTTERSNAVWMLNRLHHTGGFAHDYWALDLWGALVLVGSLALLLLAGSGVTMWFLRHREQRLGVVVFAGALAWGLGLLVWVRLG